MSGFALIFDQKESLSVDDPTFGSFVKAVAGYKSLSHPPKIVTAGQHGLMAKFNSPTSRQHILATDTTTGSWLLVTGTVFDQKDLHGLLIDYLTQGLQVLARLDGHYALVIYDGRDDRVLIVTDPFSLIAVFYGWLGHRLFVSTSALAVAHAIQSPPDEFGARYFIAYGSVLGETTLWQNVKRVLPATAFEVDTTRSITTTYWSFEFNQAIFNLPMLKAVDCVIDTLHQTIQTGLAGEERAWLSLTGGFDSRTLAAIIHRAGLPFKCYCHGTPDARDVKLAAFISEQMGWDYEYFDLPQDWGQQRPHWLERTLGHVDAQLDVLKLSRIVREQTIKATQYQTSYWGYGGEIYRGYYWKQEFFNVGTTPKVHYDRLLEYRFLPTDQPILRDNDRWLSIMRQELKTRLQLIGEQQPEWPNTIKLDLIAKYLEYGLSGTTMSGMLGLQRVIAPFNFKAGFESVVSINHRWRRRDRLFRLILERLNPALAEIETADGGPALPMRLTNLPKFGPYWLNTAEKLVWAAGRKYLGRSLWQKRDRGPMGAVYPLEQWRRETLVWLKEQGVLQPSDMYSANLYDVNILQTFLAQADAQNFRHEALLGRIITIELALRAVDGIFKYETG